MVFAQDKAVFCSVGCIVFSDLAQQVSVSVFSPNIRNLFENKVADL